MVRPCMLTVFTHPTHPDDSILLGLTCLVVPLAATSSSTHCSFIVTFIPSLLWAPITNLVVLTLVILPIEVISLEPLYLIFFFYLLPSFD